MGRVLEAGSPNHDGLCWFVRTVWPLVHAALPDAALRIVGTVLDDTTGLTGPGITHSGPIAELGPVYDAARVFVAPARFAAGVPIKVLEAGEAGLPVVTTGLIAGQLGWTAREIAAADDPAVLAVLAVGLHQDAARWAAVRGAAADRLRREHGADRFRAGLQAVLGPYRR